MLVTINHKVFKLKIFCWFSILHQNLLNFKNGRNDTPSRNRAPPLSAIFPSEILILVSSISYLSTVKKAKWLFDGKTFIFFSLWPLFMDGVQLPQGLSHFEGAVYFLPLTSWKLLVLILTTSDGWKVKLTLVELKFQKSWDFFNFLQAITFDTFMLAKWNFLHMFHTGNTEYKKSNSHRLIQNPSKVNSTT